MNGGFCKGENDSIEKENSSSRMNIMPVCFQGLI